MRLQLRIAIAIGCVSLLALCLPALGAPSKKNHAHVGAAKHIGAQHAQKAKFVRAGSHNGRLVSMPVIEPLKRPRGGWPALVAEARKYMGTNPTSRKRLWCATFMNLVLHKVGYAGTNSDAARSFAYYGHRISSPQVGAIAVLTRGRAGGHVGVVTGVDPHGNPIIISGNHGNRVGEGIYPRSRVIAYVMPTQSRPLTQVADRSSAPRATASGPDIDSPITELIAAIEAEQAKADAARPTAKPQQPERPSQLADAPRAGEQPRGDDTQPTAAAEPPTPHRTVKQTPDQSVDPAVADMVGLKDRASAPIPPGLVPYAPQRLRRGAGRVAAADIIR